jgi:hypothetical protein
MAHCSPKGPSAAPGTLERGAERRERALHALVLQRLVGGQLDPAGRRASSLARGCGARCMQRAMEAAKKAHWRSVKAGLLPWRGLGSDGGAQLAAQALATRAHVASGVQTAGKRMEPYSWTFCFRTGLRRRHGLCKGPRYAWRQGPA